MSGTQVSSFPTMNEMLAPQYLNLQQQQQAQRNQLFPYQMQEEQQKVGDADTAYAARASSALLQIPGEDARAAMYPQVVAEGQQRGFLKNAPSVYPGEAALRRIQAMGLTLPEQYQYGVVTSPGLDAALKAATAPLTGPTPSSGSGGAGGGTSEFNYGNIRPQGGTGFNTYATPQDGIAAMSSNLAAYANQHGINTLNGLTARWAPKGDGANDPVAYAKRLGAALGIDPDAEINLADPLLQTRLIPAMAAVEKGRPFDQPSDVLTAGIQKGLGRGGTTVAVAGPGGGVAARYPGAVQTAGPAAGAPAGSTAPATTMPDLVGPRSLPPIGPGTPQVTPQQLANTPMPAAPPPTATNQLAVGGANGPQISPAAAPAATPPAAPAPAAGPPLQTGLQSPQVQNALELQRRAAALAPWAALPQVKATIDRLNAEAAIYLQSDVMQPTTRMGAGGVPIPGEVNLRTNEFKAYPYAPSPRFGQVPGYGTVMAGGGQPPQFFPINPAGLTTQKAAESTGSAIGPNAVKQTEALMAQGPAATQAITNIDYGLRQVADAAAGGIPAGRYAGTLAGLAAAGKYLAPDTMAALGISPDAVSSVQTAQKTLAVLSGAILRQAIGDGQLTDAKIENFVHAQPNIENDPGALGKILNWARTQYVYTQEMSAAASEEAGKPENNGVLPSNWRAKYFHEHGFGPIYNPATGETEQPEGRAPSREPPGASPPVGTIKRGYRFKGGDPSNQTNWEPVQ